MRLLFQRKRDPRDTNRRTEAVDIRHTMPHNDDTVFTCDDLTQRLCLHARLYSRIFLHLLALAAIIRNIFRRLYNGLIAAPSKRQIDRISCKLVILRIGQPVKPHTDTQCDCHLIADVDRLHILQHIKPVLLKLRHRLFPHNHQILILLHLLGDAVQRGNIFIDFSVYQGDQKGTPDLLHALQRLIVIIQINKPHRKALVVNLSEGDL